VALRRMNKPRQIWRILKNHGTCEGLTGASN
jgi:hypothetical protein